jgi:DHA1 family multidrug resistance protein-like MFS transporter
MARSLGVFYFAFNVGIIAGAPVGGLVARVGGLASPLFVYAGILVISGLLYLRFVHDPSTPEVEPPLSPGEALAERQIPVLRRTRTKVGGLLRQPAFVTVLVVNMAYFWFVGAVYDTLLPLFGRDGLGMSTVGISVVFAIALLAELLVLYPAGSWADRIGRKPVMIPALAGLALVTALTGLAPTPVVYGLLMVPLGLVSGLAGVPPAAMLSDVAPEEGSGTAVGMFRFCGDLGFVFGPLLAGVSTRVLGFKGAFAISTLPVLLALALVLTTPETLKRAGASDRV